MKFLYLVFVWVCFFLQSFNKVPNFIMASTRRDTSCPIFGHPSNLKDSVLPTHLDVMKYFLFVRNDLLWKGNKKNPSVAEICELVAVGVERIWEKASLPIVSHKEVIRLLKAYNQKYLDLKKLPSSRKGTEQRKKEFQGNADRLFDISSCKCLDFEKCKCITKIPSSERNFLIDQRSNRKMAIGSLDMASTIQMNKRLDRKMKYSKKSVQNIESYQFNTNENELHTSDSDDTIEDNQDEDYESHSAYHQKRMKPTIDENRTPEITPTPQQMRVPLPNLALACERAGVSDRAGAILGFFCAPRFWHCFE